MWFTPWQSLTTAKSGMITKNYVPNSPIKRRVLPRHDCLPVIRGNAASSGLWSVNRDYSKFTRIFACAMPPIARVALYRSNCAAGNFAAFSVLCGKTDRSHECMTLGAEYRIRIDGNCDNSLTNPYSDSLAEAC